MHGVSGVDGAAPVWAALMAELHRGHAPLPPPPPPGVRPSRVQFGGLEPARDEWFVSGTEQTRFALDSIASSPTVSRSSGRQGNGDGDSDPSAAMRILSPADGTIVALDPDIPPAHQRLCLVAGDPLARADPAAGAPPRRPAGPRWLIDGRPIALGPKTCWLPMPGRHRVVLADARGRELDSVAIEVRGAGLADAAATGPDGRQPASSPPRTADRKPPGTR